LIPWQHLRNAQNKYDLTDRRMAKFGGHLDKSRDRELEEVEEPKQIEGNQGEIS